MRILLSICIFACLFHQPVRAQKKIIGYYAGWMQSVLPASQVKYDKLTHINHAFAWPDGNGNILPLSGLVYPQLNTLAHQNNVKVLISLGGWGNSGGFAGVAADSAIRAFFIDNLISFIQTNQYDGADFDWEFPSNPAERTGLSQLIHDVRQQFDLVNPEWLITMAVPAGNWSGQWQDYDYLRQHVDWFNAMCYDMHGGWSSHSGHNAPLFQPSNDVDGAVDVAMNYLHGIRGIPKDQLTVGIPFYGKEFFSSALYSSFSGPVTDYRYYEILPKLNGGWNYHWDAVSMVPWLTNTTGTRLITFDDTVSVRHKSQWIKTEGYAGAMIWALGQDKSGTDQPLLETIGSHLLSPTTIHSPESPLSGFELNPNFPNPFNSQTRISFTLNHAGFTRIRITDIQGRVVKTLMEKKLSAGQHNFVFDFSTFPSGIYYYSVVSGGMEQTRRMVLLK